MMSQCMILVILVAIASSAQAGIIGHQAFVAPYASSYNAHHINHAVAHPLLGPAPVAVPVPAPAVLAAPVPAPVAVPAPALLSGPVPAPHLFAAPAPHFLPAPAPFAYQAGFPANYNLWK